jgi:hypothetical protein
MFARGLGAVSRLVSSTTCTTDLQAFAVLVRDRRRSIKACSPSWLFFLFAIFSLQTLAHRKPDLRSRYPSSQPLPYYQSLKQTPLLSLNMKFNLLFLLPLAISVSAGVAGRGEGDYGYTSTFTPSTTTKTVTATATTTTTATKTETKTATATTTSVLTKTVTATVTSYSTKAYGYAI